LRQPSKEDIADRVLQLVNPEKWETKQQAKQPATETAAQPATVKAPENIILTQAGPKVDWKDHPESVVANYRVGVKQQPGHAADRPVC
jgi:hypothetical protein